MEIEPEPEIKNNNILNDNKLLKLLNDNFNTDEQQLFINQFKLYLEYGYDNTKFIIDFDDIYKWLGFTQKTNAKRLLINKFKENKNYCIFFRTEENKKGRKKEQIMLNITTFKKYCMVAGTEKSFEIYDYYIKMEEIYNQYLKEKLIEYNDIINNNNLELEDLKQKNNISYDEIAKKEYIYVLSTDIQNVYKIGKTKSIDQRLRGLQTGNVNDIQILYEYKTSNNTLLEAIVHYILERYKCNNREHFKCNLEYIKKIIIFIGDMMDTLKSTYEIIDINNIIDKFNDKINIHIDNNDYLTKKYNKKYIDNETNTEIIDNNKITKELENNIKIIKDTSYIFNNNEHKLNEIIDENILFKNDIIKPYKYLLPVKDKINIDIYYNLLKNKYNYHYSKKTLLKDMRACNLRISSSKYYVNSKRCNYNYCYVNEFIQIFTK